MGKASRTLKAHDQATEAKEMSNRIMGCGSYNEALNIIGEYVNIVGDDDPEFEINMD